MDIFAILICLICMMLSMIIGTMMVNRGIDKPGHYWYLGWLTNIPLILYLFSK